MKAKSNLVKVLLTTLLVVFCFAISLIGCYTTDYKIDSTWQDGIGVLTRKDRGKGSSSKFLYKFRDTRYDEFSLESVYMHGYTLGEKYAIKIDPKKPTRYFVLSWMPMFTPDESRDTVQGKIERIFRFRYTFNDPNKDAKYGITFSYRNLDGQKYEREQNLPPDYNPNKSTLKKGQEFPVEYWSDDYRRAIMHLKY